MKIHLLHGGHSMLECAFVDVELFLMQPLTTSVLGDSTNAA